MKKHRLVRRIVLFFFCMFLLHPGEHAQAKAALNKKTVTIAVEESTKLKVEDTKKKVVWSSNKENIVSVSAKGKITGKKKGTAVVTATVGKKELTCKVTVKKGKNLSQENVYKKMMALKKKYPEGKTWTNDDFYAWNGGIYSYGLGCAAFTFILSDEAFGNLPARIHHKIKNIKVGDILRVNGDSHSVIVLEVHEDGFVLAEGNYNSSIHWGRTLTRKEAKETVDYVMTRYPK